MSVCVCGGLTFFLEKSPSWLRRLMFKAESPDSSASLPPSQSVSQTLQTQSAYAAGGTMAPHTSMKGSRALVHATWLISGQNLGSGIKTLSSSVPKISTSAILARQGKSCENAKLGSPERISWMPGTAFLLA